MNGWVQGWLQVLHLDCLQVEAGCNPRYMQCLYCPPSTHTQPLVTVS
jgi:hypothetical protein